MLLYELNDQRMWTKLKRVFIFISSEENYDAFCLAYMFTFRDFEGGTLGLAWTGDLKNAGGVCEKNGVSFLTLLYHNNDVYSVWYLILILF